MKRFEYFYCIEIPGQPLQRFGPYLTIGAARREGLILYKMLDKGGVRKITLSLQKWPRDRIRADTDIIMKCPDPWKEARKFFYAEDAVKLLEQAREKEGLSKEQAWAVRLRCDIHRDKPTDWILVPEHATALVVCSECNYPIAQVMLTHKPKEGEGP